ncbi:methyltransferase [Streptomyces fagopyri]|uniref:Methyltransferase n=1 Tax=Streptomyces fagopyri TaxID=2662397 RepID=A0A5Q0LPV1_9ACTN|nr:HemK2/MTQ2 family protein methyltransferase [Streptomyces fagopyri]QFZ79101.1 methyltransferase [Streptomyces fagopyri]
MVLPGVYRPQADTQLLAHALAAEIVRPAAEILEIGTGTGALALSAAGRGARVTAVDVSWRAVTTARLNALRRRLPLRVLHGDFTACTHGRRYDIVLANPPYVPAPSRWLPSRGPARAWDAGPDGRLVIDRICASAPGLLRPGGILLMVHSAMCDPDSTLKRLAQAGLAGQTTVRARVPWGPVLRGRRAWLQNQGLADVGEDQEELVIIRAEAL